MFLDASRWISAWAVAFGHVRSFVFVARDAMVNANPLLDAFVLAAGFGHTAVIVFFVISGHLVGGGLARLEPTPAQLAAYAIDRLSRLYCVLVPAFVLIWAMAVLRYLIDGSMIELASLEYRWATLAKNLLFLQTIMGPSYGNDFPLWSLANEFWYYVAFPLLLLIVRGKAWPTRLLMAATLLLIPVLVGFQITLYFSIWLLGVVAALGRLPRLPVWLAGALFALICVVSRVWIRDGFLIDFATGAAFALLVFSVSARPHTGARAGPKAWARLHSSLASWSFSLYVVHAPIMLMLGWIIFGRLDSPALQPTGGAGWMWLILMLAGVLAGAKLFAMAAEDRTATVRHTLYRWFGVPLRRPQVVIDVAPIASDRPA